MFSLKTFLVRKNPNKPITVNLIIPLGDVIGQQIGVSSARMVNVKDIVQNSSHILGRHAVHILPYG